MLVTRLWIENNYKKFNDLYWGGELPKRVIFKVGRSKNNWGQATCMYDPYAKRAYGFTLTISNYFDSPEQVKLSTLLHEMIHIYDYYNFPEHLGMRGYNFHGYSVFLKECERLKQFGWDINAKVTAEEKEESTVSENVIERQKKKSKDGVYLWVTYPKKDGNDFFVSKLNEKQAQRVKFSVSSGLANRIYGDNKHCVLLKYHPKDLNDETTQKILVARANTNRVWLIKNDYMTDSILNNSDKICEVI